MHEVHWLVLAVLFGLIWLGVAFYIIVEWIYSDTRPGDTAALAALEAGSERRRTPVESGDPQSAVIPADGGCGSLRDPDGSRPARGVHTPGRFSAH
jgi:hypothetical protein